MFFQDTRHNLPQTLRDNTARSRIRYDVEAQRNVKQRRTYASAILAEHKIDADTRNGDGA